MTKITYTSFFPEKSDKKSVTQLQSLVKRCAKELQSIQEMFQFPTLQLPDTLRNRLAEILVDFTLDIHSGSGIWTALEKYNTELFGTPLPLILPQNAKLPTGICVERVQFLLWNLYPQLDPGRVLSNHHSDLLIAAKEVTELLNELLPSFPAISPIKEFLDKPNDYGWEVKRKLVWLGMYSYLFRLPFGEYMDERYDGEDSPIMVIDDFICQNTTSWSGLGPNDIIAGCLNLPDEQREDVRNWYERHFAVYKITKVDDEITEAVNLINDAHYRIREGSPSFPRTTNFRPNMLIYGTLVPYRDEWYWSGEVVDFTPLSKKELAETLRRIKLNTQVVARYWKEREKAVFQMAEENYQQSLKFYGNDLLVFPDGRTLKRKETQRLVALNEARGGKGMAPNMSLWEDLLDSNDGLGVFLDPVEGQEIMEYFDELRSGLKKNGKALTPDEGEVLRAWIGSTSICPAFVHRGLKEYSGEESVKKAFCLETDDPCWLEFLLRCNKGEYYRRRYPCISLVD